MNARQSHSLRGLPSLLAGVVLGTSAVATACGPKEGRAHADDAPAEAPAPKVDVSAEVLAKLGEVLGAYERIRASLADDAIAAVPDAAAALQTTATAAAAAAPASVAPRLHDIAQAAGVLKATGTGDANAVRKSFGEVSRAVVKLVNGVPALQSGRSLFECPMAQGYKRWVQPGEKMANPYMGKAMLECGTPRKWGGAG